MSVKLNKTSVSFVTGFICTCSQGWVGSDCDTDLDECVDHPCKNNGTCVNIDGSYLCICPPYWTGAQCEADRLECNTALCGNGGTCLEQAGAPATCLCVPGKSGIK